MQEPGSTGEPDGGHDASSVPDEVWRRFVEDSEDAILRSTAPREPSARERATATDLRPPGATTSGTAATESVGELWQPKDREARPAWHALDSRGRRRRVVGRLLGVAAAAVLVGLLVQRPAGSGGPYGEGGDATTQQSEHLPEELPTATALYPPPHP